jgi:ribosome-binding factor A
VKTRKQRLQVALLCDALGADDGIESRGRQETRRRPRRTHHQEQVARQAERVLSLALCDSADPVLQDLDVLAVAAVGSSLQVTVAPLPDGDAPSASTIHAALHRASGRLRALVSEAITRKRVPELVFSVCDESGVDHG